MISAKGIVAPSAIPDEMLIGRIVEHEGMKKFAYNDSGGYITVGIGRCIDSRVASGLSTEECFYLLKNDIAACRKQLNDFNWYKNLDDVRQDALVELCFNMGLPHLLEFKDMIDALSLKSFSKASSALLDSQWSTQVGSNRSQDIAYRISFGRYK